MTPFALPQEYRGRHAVPGAGALFCKSSDPSLTEDLNTPLGPTLAKGYDGYGVRQHRRLISGEPLRRSHCDLTAARIALFDLRHRLAGHPGETLNLFPQSDGLGRARAVLQGVLIALGSAATGAVHPADVPERLAIDIGARSASIWRGTSVPGAYPRAWGCSPVFSFAPPPCTLHVFAAGLIGRLAGRASLPGATFCPLCHEYLGGTRAPVGWPRCKSSGELRLERQYRD